MLGRLYRNLFSRHTTADPVIMSRAEFHEVVRRERNRVHRTGERFALVLFTAEPNSYRRRTWQKLAAALAQDLRSTDAMGWWGQQQLGCLLPSTELSGATVVAMRATCTSGLADVKFKIVCYPADFEFDDDSATVSIEDQQELETRIAQPMPLAKRAFDITAAGAGVVLLSPLFGLIALLIKCTSRGPVFFRQSRAGLGGKRFQMFKFRTMYQGAEQEQHSLRELNERDGPAFKISRDPRVTPVGAILRTTSLDELPQLWNVVRGEMSLVGPRPLPSDESDACEAWQKERLDVTPGLTCSWQVGDRQRVTFAEWMRMDIRYGRSSSLWQDLSLIVRTLPVVLLRRGAQ